MTLSIRDASRFILGAAMMRSRAIESSGNLAIAFDEVAQMSFIAGADGQKIRQSINVLSDNEPGTLRNTPPHILKTDRVLTSREAELATFRAIGSAITYTIELAESASHDNVDYEALMHNQYVEAYRLIDQTPGSTQDRRQLEELLRVQAINVSNNSEFVAEMLKSAESAYLDGGADEILSRYATALEPSNNFEM